MNVLATSLGLLLVAHMQGDSVIPEQVCADPSRFVGPCVTVRGRLSYANGGTPVRMWKVGTNRLLGVEDQSSGKPFCVLPPKVRGLLDADMFVFADFVVRPLTVDRPAAMQRVCVVSARNLRTKPAYFLKSTSCDPLRPPAEPRPCPSS